MTGEAKSNLLAGSVIGLLLAYWIAWSFGWYAILFMPWAVWEVYAIIGHDERSLITHAMMRLLKQPLVSAVLAVAVWHFFLAGKGLEVHRAALATGLLAHFVFQNQIAYQAVWAGSVEDPKYGRVKLRDKRLRPGEPVFVLRGQDKLAPTALSGLAAAYEDKGLDSSAVLKRRREFVQWAVVNGSKVPD